MSASFLNPKARPDTSSIHGHGVRCTERIAPGEVVVAFGGRCTTADEFGLLPVERQTRSVQIDERLYLVSSVDPEPGNMVNHSCRPNCRLSGQMLVVAARQIAPGEELTFDYATCAGSDYDEFECQCGAADCRGKVTGHDWMLPEVQLRRRGSFSPYLARRIAALAEPIASRRVFGL